MTGPLDFTFPLMSPLSDRPPHAIGRDEQLIALEEELEARIEAFPRMVKERRISEEDATRRRRILKMMVEEAHLAVHRDDIPEAEFLRRDQVLRDREWSWADRVREIRATLAYRRNSVPLQIKSFHLDEVDGRQRLERLDAVHFTYWIGLTGIDRGPDLRGLEPSIAADICRGLHTTRDHWLLGALRGGDRAVVAYMEPWPKWRRDIASRSAAVHRGIDITRLHELRPDLVPGHYQQEQAA